MKLAAISSHRCTVPLIHDVNIAAPSSQPLPEVTAFRLAFSRSDLDSNLLANDEVELAQVILGMLYDDASYVPSMSVLELIRSFNGKAKIGPPQADVQGL